MLSGACAVYVRGPSRWPACSHRGDAGPLGGVLGGGVEQRLRFFIPVGSLGFLCWRHSFLLQNRVVTLGLAMSWAVREIKVDRFSSLLWGNCGFKRKKKKDMLPVKQRTI